MAGKCFFRRTTECGSLHFEEWMRMTVKLTQFSIMKINDGNEYADRWWWRWGWLREFTESVQPTHPAMLPGLGCWQDHEGRLFHSLAVLGKNKYMWAFVLEYGIENLLRNESVRVVRVWYRAGERFWLGLYEFYTAFQGVLFFYSASLLVNAYS